MTTATTRAQQERTAYGWGLALDDGDVIIDGGRLTEVSGLANLEQGLLLRIATPLASDRLSTTYGLDVSDAFTAGLTRDLTKQVLRLSLIRTLASDPRVAAIDQVLFDDDPEYLAEHPEATGSTSRRAALVEITVQPNNPVGSATGAGETAALAAGAGADTVSFLADVRW